MPADHGKIANSGPSGAPTPIAFQLEDVRKYAADILKKAAEQAARKLDAAGKQATDIEKAAYDDGFKKGREEGFTKGEPAGRAAGEKAARKEFEDKVKGVAEALQALLEELNARKVELQGQADAGFMRLSLTLAEKLVRREIELDEKFLGPVLREALSLAGDRSDVVIKANADDLAAIEEELPELHAAFTDLGKVHLETDAALGRGEILAVTRGGEIDMRLARQMEALETALLGEKAKVAPAAEGAGDSDREEREPGEDENR